MFSATEVPVKRTLPRPVRRELPANVTTKFKELAAAREALLDTRNTADRVVDSVVNRMLTELRW